MDEESAKKVIEIAISFDIGLGTIDEILSNLAEGDDKNTWILRLGNTIMAINEELIIPIEKQFPTLRRIY